jgi:hypothetical protein
MPASERSVFVRAAGAALAAGIALDAATALAVPALRPPWLLVEHAAEVFREFIGPRVLSFAVGITSAAIAGLLAVAFRDAPRRFLRLAVGFAALGLASGVVMLLVYFPAPARVAVGSVAGIVLRALGVAWVVELVLRGADPGDPSR